MNQRTVSAALVDGESRASRALAATEALASASTRAARALDRHAADFELSDAKLQLLGVLRCSEGCRACLYTLGDELRVSRPNVTKLVDGLERGGLVERTPHPTDRRMVHARLTSEGERIADAALPGRARIADALWADASDEAIELLTATLREVGR